MDINSEETGDWILYYLNSNSPALHKNIQAYCQRLKKQGKKFIFTSPKKLLEIYQELLDARYINSIQMRGDLGERKYKGYDISLKGKKYLQQFLNESELNKIVKINQLTQEELKENYEVLYAIYEGLEITDFLDSEYNITDLVTETLKLYSTLATNEGVTLIQNITSCRYEEAKKDILILLVFIVLHTADKANLYRQKMQYFKENIYFLEKYCHDMELDINMARLALKTLFSKTELYTMNLLLNLYKIVGTKTIENEILVEIYFPGDLLETIIITSTIRDKLANYFINVNLKHDISPLESVLDEIYEEIEELEIISRDLIGKPPKLGQRLLNSFSNIGQTVPSVLNAFSPENKSLLENFLQPNPISINSFLSKPDFTSMILPKEGLFGNDRAQTLMVSQKKAFYGMIFEIFKNEAKKIYENASTGLLTVPPYYLQKLDILQIENFTEVLGSQDIMLQVEQAKHFISNHSFSDAIPILELAFESTEYLAREEIFHLLLDCCRRSNTYLPILEYFQSYFNDSELSIEEYVDWLKLLLDFRKYDDFQEILLDILKKELSEFEKREIFSSDKSLSPNEIIDNLIIKYSIREIPNNECVSNLTPLFVRYYCESNQVISEKLEEFLPEFRQLKPILLYRAINAKNCDKIMKFLKKPVVLFGYPFLSLENLKLFGIILILKSGTQEQKLHVEEIFKESVVLTNRFLVKQSAAQDFKKHVNLLIQSCWKHFNICADSFLPLTQILITLDLAAEARMLYSMFQPRDLSQNISLLNKIQILIGYRLINQKRFKRNGKKTALHTEYQESVQKFEKKNRIQIKNYSNLFFL